MDELKKKTLTDEILPEAIKLRTDRLLIKRVKTSWEVPTFNETNLCSRFTIPTKEGDLKEEDMSNIDFMLYVASGASGHYDPPAWALTCAVDAQNNRPIIGAMHVKAEVIKFGKGTVRLLALELGHALGFDYKRMSDLGVITSHTIRGKNRTVANSTKTLEKTKKHYKCEPMKGMGLEDQTKSGSQPTLHWMKRYAKDELMSDTKFSLLYENIGYYTALTIAAFEDLGFYKGNYLPHMQQTMHEQIRPHTTPHVSTRVSAYSRAY
ncbi:Peptidase M8 [Trypanosoma melophagium]|uniref:Peptidase M8 n=1 Tax=Trypanosoma melophagium TaxID=715481 RepID=UPI00351A80F8|nr:Peptidase M8 [Trypanosoma melophagium]